MGDRRRLPFALCLTVVKNHKMAQLASTREAAPEAIERCSCLKPVSSEAAQGVGKR